MLYTHPIYWYLYWYFQWRDTSDLEWVADDKHHNVTLYVIITTYLPFYGLQQCNVIVNMFIIFIDHENIKIMQLLRV